jgi:hypothetical protein
VHSAKLAIAQQSAASLAIYKHFLHGFFSREYTKFTAGFTICFVVVVVVVVVVIVGVPWLGYCWHGACNQIWHDFCRQLFKLYLKF